MEPRLVSGETIEGLRYLAEWDYAHGVCPAFRMLAREGEVVKLRSGMLLSRITDCR